MNRRSFLSSVLALGAAPAIVRADSLMRIVPRETALLPTPMRWAPMVMDAESAQEIAKRAWCETTYEFQLARPAMLGCGDIVTLAAHGINRDVRIVGAYWDTMDAGPTIKAIPVGHGVYSQSSIQRVTPEQITVHSVTLSRAA